jgi:hypothetical protein
MTFYKTKITPMLNALALAAQKNSSRKESSKRLTSTSPLILESVLYRRTAPVVLGLSMIRTWSIIIHGFELVCAKNDHLLLVFVYTIRPLHR